MRITVFTFCLMVELVASSLFIKAEELTHADFSVGPPKGWTHIEADIEGIVAVYMDDIRDNFTASIVICCDKALASTTEQHSNLFKEEVIKRFPTAEFLFSRDVNQDGLIWKETVYKYLDMGRELQILRCHTVLGDKAYSFTGTALASSFPGYLNTFRDSFSKWKFNIPHPHK